MYRWKGSWETKIEDGGMEIDRPTDTEEENDILNIFHRLDVCACESVSVCVCMCVCLLYKRVL